MPPQWRKRGEILPEMDSKKEPMKVQFPVDDLDPRNRKKSFKEKIADVVQEGAKILTITSLKLKKKKDKETFLEEKKTQEKNEEDTEKFRQLIAFIFREEYLQEFLSILQAMGFEHLGGAEYLGWRDADYSIAKNIDLLHRLHMRLYNLNHVVYVLVHHEPKANKDIKLHVKGYFDHILKDLKDKEKNKSDENNNQINSEEKTSIPQVNSPMQERFELSNYEKGGEILIEMLKQSVPNFYQKLDFDISDDELQIWHEYMGQIDHIPPEQRLIEDLWQNSRYIPPFQTIRSTGKRFFELFGFKASPAWDLKIPPSDKYMIISAESGEIKFQALVIFEDFTEDLMRVIGSLRSKYKVENVFLITTEIGLFGPAEDDIPPDNVEIKPFLEKEVKEMVSFFTDSGITIFPCKIFIELFNLHLKNPLRITHFQFISRHKGLITSEIIQEMLKENETYKKLYDEMLKFIELLRQEPHDKWNSMKNIKKMAVKANLSISEIELHDFIVFLENPFLNVLESKDKKREEYRINPKLTEMEFERISKKIEKLLKEFLIERQ
jgi:hypothetical protein